MFAKQIFNRIFKYINKKDKVMNKKIEAITLEEIKEQCPHAFQVEPSEKVSNKYTFVPTIKAIEDIMSLGWLPIRAIAVKSRKKATEGVGKHMIEFEHPDFLYDEEGERIRILLQNSHDGSSNFKLDIGVFRLVCSNGLVVKSKDMGAIKVRHMGYSFEEVKQAVNTLIENVPTIFGTINQMKSIQLSDADVGKLALKSVAARFKLDLTKQEEANAAKDIVDLDDILNVQRVEDEGNGLYEVFNRIQEKLVNGGFNYVNLETNKVRKARPIKNFQQNVKLNQQLWEMAEEFIG